MTYEDYKGTSADWDPYSIEYKIAEFVATRSDLLTKTEMYEELVKIVDNIRSKAEKEGYDAGYDAAYYTYSRD